MKHTFEVVEVVELDDTPRRSILNCFSRLSVTEDCFATTKEIVEGDMSTSSGIPSSSLHPSIVIEISY